MTNLGRKVMMTVHAEVEVVNSVNMLHRTSQQYATADVWGYSHRAKHLRL